MYKYKYVVLCKSNADTPDKSTPSSGSFLRLNYDFYFLIFIFLVDSRALTGLRAVFARVAGTPDCRYTIQVDDIQSTPGV